MTEQVIYLLKKVRRHSGFLSKQFRMCSDCHLIKSLKEFGNKQYHCKTCKKSNRSARGLSDDLYHCISCDACCFGCGTYGSKYDDYLSRGKCAECAMREDGMTLEEMVQITQ